MSRAPQQPADHGPLGTADKVDAQGVGSVPQTVRSARSGVVYYVAPELQSEVALLSRQELRSIEHSVDANRNQYFLRRKAPPSSCIPDFQFEAKRPVGDEVVDAVVVQLREADHSFDVPLRFAPPAGSSMPLLVDPYPSASLSKTISALIKGLHSAPARWPAERCGGDRDVVHVAQLRDAAEHAKAALRSGHTAAAARAQCSTGALYYNVGSLELALRAFEGAAKIFSEVDDAQGLAFCHNVMGVICYRLGEVKMSLIHYRQQQSLCSAYGKAVALVNQAISYSALGNFLFATQALEDAMIHAEASQDRFLIGTVFGNLGVTQLRSGEMRAASKSFTECLNMFSADSNRAGACVCLLLLGELYLLLRDYAHALFYYEQAVKVGADTERNDVVELARVCIGVCKGCLLSHEVTLAVSREMGATASASDVLDCF